MVSGPVGSGIAGGAAGATVAHADISDVLPDASVAVAVTSVPFASAGVENVFDAPPSTEALPSHVCACPHAGVV